jgi:hypothetical protein
MKSICVISHCQLTPITACLEFLFPHSSIIQVPLTHLRTEKDRNALKAKIKNCDVVFSIPAIGDYGEFQHDQIKGLHNRVIFVPSVDFVGFHPDVFYLNLNSGGVLRSPIGDYNSIICAAGYLKGLPARRIAALFNALIFGRLGYFGEFAASRQELVDRFAYWSKIDVSPLVDGWMKRGSFMYTVNHPKLYVISSIISTLCAAEGLIGSVDFNVGDLLPDALADGPVCPVLPEIAGRLGVQGSRVFKPSTGHGDRVFTLDQYVGLTLETYQASAVSNWVISPTLERAMVVLGEIA